MAAATTPSSLRKLSSWTWRDVRMRRPRRPQGKSGNFRGQSFVQPKLLGRVDVLQPSFVSKKILEGMRRLYLCRGFVSLPHFFPHFSLIKVVLEIFGFRSFGCSIKSQGLGRTAGGADLHQSEFDVVIHLYPSLS